MTVIVGTGIDVVDVERFGDIAARRPGFLDRLLTSAEQGASDGSVRPLHSLAARFAAKEAMAKALGAPSGLQWHHCEVLSDDVGKPYFNLTGTVLAAAQSVGATTWHLSLSHDGGIAIASVILESVP